MKITHLTAIASFFAGLAVVACLRNDYQRAGAAFVSFAFFGWRAIVMLLENPPNK